MYRRLLPVVLSLALGACSNKDSSTTATGGSDTAGATGGTTDATTGGTPTADANSAPAGPAYPACSTDGTISAGTQAASCSTATTASVNIVVDVTKGPNSFTSPITLTNNLYNMGIDDQTRSDYIPSLNPNYVSYLKALHPGMLRFPAGHNGQFYTWQSTEGKYNMTPALVDGFISLCKAVGAEPFMAINLETPTTKGYTTDYAKNLLTYANVTKKYGVTWWQLGNEPNLSSLWPDESPALYSSKFNTFRTTMLAIDPTLKFVGLESYTGEAIHPNPSEPNWLLPFLSGVTANTVDAIAWHYYPLYSSENNATSTSSSVPSVAHLLQEDATDWPPAALNYPDKIIPYMRTNMTAKASKSQIWIDEYAEDSGTTLNGVGYGDTMVGALWAADSMGRYAAQGTDAIFHFIFKAIDSRTPNKYGYALLDDNDIPRPEYYTIWMMANLFGDTMVNAKSDATAKVNAHAAIKASDCSLRVMLINKATTAQSVRLTLKGYTPQSASQYNLVGTGYQTSSVTFNGTSLTAANVGNGETAVPAAAATACTDNVFSLKPYSVNMMVFKKTP